MGPISLKIGLSSNVCIRSNRSNKKWPFYYKKSQKFSKTLFLSTFNGFMGSKIHFHGSHKPQNGFILISSFGFLPIFMELRSLEQLHMTSAVLSSQIAQNNKNSKKDSIYARKYFFQKNPLIYINIL